MNLRLRRSVLYLPGSNARALEKARGLAADGLIFDLEDAVAPEAKARARQQVVQALGAGGYGQRERIIRVNGLDTPWGNDDVAAVASTDADAVLFPKVENADQVADAVAALGKAGAPEAMALWLMIETPRGVLDVDSIAGSHRRLDCLVMGTSDLAKETRIPHTPDRRGLVAALSHCVYAARAWGLGILDGVHLALDDAEGLVAACRQGRELGFDGKTLIHPKQIDTANEFFAPSTHEVEHARQIISAFEEAITQGRGVVVVNGQLVENLHVEEARRVLALAQAME